MDERVNAGIAPYEAALKQAGINYQLFMYEGAQHAFHNDTAPTRYHAEATNLPGKGCGRVQQKAEVGPLLWRNFFHKFIYDFVGRF